MRLVLERVEQARAVDPTDGSEVAAIGRGLVAYVGFERDDTEALVRRAAARVPHLRLVERGDSLFGRSVADSDGAILVLFQLPMTADLSRGRKPNFSRAAAPDDARALFDAFVEAMSAEGVPVVAGPFAAHLHLHAVGRGPFVVPWEIR